jgi:hypothetical protein
LGGLETRSSPPIPLPQRALYAPPVLPLPFCCSRAR